MKKIFAALTALVASVASGATSIPVPLLSGAGSSVGQAIVSTGATSAPAWASIPISGLSSIAANTVLANGTGASAPPAAFAMPGCSNASNALNWTTSTGFGCNTSINAATLGGTSAASYALLASPTFTGTPAAPTATAGTNSTQLATTAFVATSFAPLASPALSGVPTTPTASATTNTTQIASTAMVNSAITGGSLAGSFTTLNASGLISPTSTIGIKGTSTNDNAQAGSIGECIPTGCGPTSTTGTSMSTNTPTNCTSVPLTAGQWLVWGEVLFQPSAVLGQILAGISTTSATTPALGLSQSLATSFTSANNQAIAAPAQILKLASTTTVYMIGLASITSGTLTCNGYIYATRMR